MAFYDAVNCTCAKVILLVTAHIPHIEYEQSHKIGPLFTLEPGQLYVYSDEHFGRNDLRLTDSSLLYAPI